MYVGRGTGPGVGLLGGSMEGTVPFVKGFGFKPRP